MTQTIVRGNTITLDANYTDATNALVTPTSPQVSIINANGTTVVALDTPTEVGLGHYIYDYAVGASAPVGVWTARWYGIIDGDPVTADDLFIVAATASSGGGVGAFSSNGPCGPWATAGEVQATGRAIKEDGTALDQTLLLEMIEVASGILYRLSGRQYAGVCTDSVRPTARWFRVDNYAPRIPSAGMYGLLGNYTDRPPHRNQGQSPSREVSLGAYPIREIVEVRIGGEIIPSTDYQVVDRRWLARISDDGSGWPIAPDLDGDPLNAAATNTFQVTFTWGQAPPAGGVRAVIEYAIELAKAASGDPCNLPARVTSLQMPGTTFSLLDPMTFIDQGKTGIYLVDMWLHSVNPHGITRRSSVMSPDHPRPVRRVAQTPGS